MKSAQTEARLSSLLALGLCVFTLIACSLSKQLLNKKTMFEGASAKEAGDAFKAKLGGPIKALSLELELNAATLKAQDPKNPEHVDEYKYVKGIVLGPTPVQLNLLERNLKDTLFDLDDINLAATEKLTQTALERAAIEGGKVTKMTIERGLSLAKDMTKSGNVHWAIEIRGTRESATASADAKGTLLGVDLSQTARAANFSTYSADTLRDAGPKIKDAFGGHVRLVELIIYDKYLWFKALSPKDSEITQYKYDINGVTTSALHNIGDNTPIGLRMSRGAKLEDFVFDLNDVKLEMAPELGQKALAKLGLVGGRISLYKISKVPVHFGQKELMTSWDVSCQRDRKSGSVMYDLAGNEVKANQ